MATEFTTELYPDFNQDEGFLILNSYTDKYIPLKTREKDSTDTDVVPNLIYFSYSEIPSDFQFSSEQEGYTGYSIYSGSQDDWGNLKENSKGIRVGIPFVEKHKQQFNYTFSGNTNGSWSGRTNGVYSIEDENAEGASRRWRHPEGTFIKWVEKRWVMTFNANMTTLPNDLTWNENQIAAYTDEQSDANAKDLSTLRWNTNGTYWSSRINVNSSRVEISGQKTVWLVLGHYTESEEGAREYFTSNVVSFKLSVQTNEITNTLFEVTGPTGNKNYAGFYIDEEKRFYPTSLVNVQYSASCPIEIRANCSSLTINGINFQTPYTKEGLVKGSGKLNFISLASPDALITMTITFQDKAGNKIELSQSITVITRLWRMIGSRIKEDDASYQTRFFSVSSTSTMNEIPKSKTSSDEFSRQWEDIFYPTTHGYPLGNDGKIDYQEALRISKGIDETGINGPTTEELTRYDQLQLTNDRTALATDSDDRYMTSGWQRNKVYSRMESSSYGESGENLRYWIIDNEGYSDLALEFEYFDLDNQISNIPPNILSPYDGDVLVVYDAQAEGCLEESVDIYGKKSYKIKDSSLLVELFAFTGSCYTGDIRMQSGAALPITQTGNGFITSNITTTSKICIILYSDNDYQASGFKIKAGPRHNVVLSNYDLNETSLVRIRPGVEKPFDRMGQRVTSGRQRERLRHGRGKPRRDDRRLRHDQRLGDQLFHPELPIHDVGIRRGFGTGPRGGGDTEHPQGLRLRMCGGIPVHSEKFTERHPAFAHQKRRFRRIHHASAADGDHCGGRDRSEKFHHPLDRIGAGLRFDFGEADHLPPGRRRCGGKFRPDAAGIERTASGEHGERSIRQKRQHAGELLPPVVGKKNPLPRSLQQKILRSHRRHTSREPDTTELMVPQMLTISVPEGRASSSSIALMRSSRYSRIRSAVSSSRAICPALRRWITSSPNTLPQSSHCRRKLASNSCTAATAAGTIDTATCRNAIRSS